MTKWMKGIALFVGVAGAAGACDTPDRATAPEGIRNEIQVMPLDSASSGQPVGASADSTGGRWGGYAGGGNG
jgi:hypothetical protein